MIKKFTGKFIEGRKCIFCRRYTLYRLKDKGVKCKKCRRQYSIKKLRRDLEILHYFCLEISANKAAKELGLSYKTAHNKYSFFRQKIAKYSDKNTKKLSGELELDVISLRSNIYSYDS